MNQNRFIVVGGKPFQSYTGTVTYTGLQIVGYAVSEEKAVKLAYQRYEEVGGLLLIVDTETGLSVGGF